MALACPWRPLDQDTASCGDCLDDLPLFTVRGQREIYFFHVGLRPRRTVTGRVIVFRMVLAVFVIRVINQTGSKRRAP